MHILSFKTVHVQIKPVVLFLDRLLAQPSFCRQSTIHTDLKLLQIKHYLLGSGEYIREQIQEITVTSYYP